MTWLIEYQMERRLAANKKLLYLLLMSYGFYYSKADDQIRNLNCYNDYETKMVCTWEVTKLETNCATEYRMIYERAIVSLPTNTCIPENVKVDDYILPNNCYCNISVSFFAAGDEYYIEIQSDGKVLINDTILPYETIKPKTPENLTVEFNENDDAILRWAESTSLDIRDHLNFRIHYYSKQDPANTYSVLREIPATQFEISSSQLKLGYDYVARIQSKVSRGYDGTWSDWSNEIEWPNDRKNYSVELIVPLSCILMIVLIVMCYIWICIIKKNTWDTIPDPGKSHFLITIGGTHQGSETPHLSDRRSFCNTQWRHFKQSCWSWLIKLAPDLLDQDFIQKQATQHTGNQPADGSKEMPKFRFSNNQTDCIPGEQQAILTPECAIVERWVSLSTPPDIETTPDDEIESEDEDKKDFEANDAMFCNSSIDDMFSKLFQLNTCTLVSSVTAIDEHKLWDNFLIENPLQPKPDTNDGHDHHSIHSLNVFSFFNGTHQPNEDEESRGSTLQKPKQTTEYNESGYRSFESEVAHLEPRTHPDPDHLSVLPQCSEIEVDLLALVQNAQSLPVNKIKKDLLGEVIDTSKLDFDPQYYSFSSAASKYKNDFEESWKYHGSPSSTSLDRFAVNEPLTYSKDQSQGSHTSQQCYNQAIGSDCQSVCSQNANLHVFPSFEGEEDSFVMPSRELFGEMSQLDIGNNIVDVDSTAVFDPSGYQSFENAVKQEKTAHDDNASLFSEDGALSDKTPGQTKEETPFDMLFWGSAMRMEEPNDHVLPTSLMDRNEEVCDNTQKGSDSNRLDLGEGNEHGPGGSLFPLPCNETCIEDKYTVGTEVQKNLLSPPICCEQDSGVTGAIPDTKNTTHAKIINLNNNEVHSSLTVNTDDDLENFETANRNGPQFNKAINGECSLVNSFPKGTEASLSHNPDVVELPSMEGVNDRAALTAQKIAVCVQPPEESSTSGKCPPLKFENVTYFLKPSNLETLLFLKENHINITAERNSIKHNMVKLNEVIDIDGNSYASVTEM